MAAGRVPQVFGIVLAGGEGKRLAPLTDDRAKPAVPFGGNYRLIDFALSNLVNAGLLQIVVLTQYKSHSLDRHVAATWRLSPLLGNYVALVPAQMRRGPYWFQGSADAIYQNLNLLYDERPDYVAVFGADHIYRMDPRQMIEQHVAFGAGRHRRSDSRADRAGERVRRDRAGAGRAARSARFARSRRIRSGCPTRPGEVFASMGNYVFTTKALIDAVIGRCSGRRQRSTISAATIIPTLVDARRAAGLRLRANDIPGATERDRGYWRDVGTLDAFYDAHMDLISVDPLFNLYNRQWPILTWPDPLPPAKFVFEDRRSHRARAGLHGLRGCHRLGRNRPPVGAVARGRASTRTAEVEGSILMHGVDVGRTRSCGTRSSTRTCASPSTRVSVSTRIETASASRSRTAAIVVIGKGAVVEADYVRDHGGVASRRRRRRAQAPDGRPTRARSSRSGSRRRPHVYPERERRLHLLLVRPRPSLARGGDRGNASGSRSTSSCARLPSSTRDARPQTRSPMQIARVCTSGSWRASLVRRRQGSTRIRSRPSVRGRRNELYLHLPTGWGARGCRTTCCDG